MQVFTTPNDETWSPVNVNFVLQYLNTPAMPEVEPISPTPDFIPTRLLDLRFSDDAEISLKATKVATHNKDRIVYAALSYCWGSAEDALRQSKLTTANMMGLCQRIANEQLSP